MGDVPASWIPAFAGMTASIRGRKINQCVGGISEAHPPEVPVDAATRLFFCPFWHFCDARMGKLNFCEGSGANFPTVHAFPVADP